MDFVLDLLTWPPEAFRWQSSQTRTRRGTTRLSLRELSPGFHREPNRLDLKAGGYQISSHSESRVRMGRAMTWALPSISPPSGRVALGGRFPGLKPWAEVCRPFGARNNGLSPGLCRQPFRATKEIEDYDIEEADSTTHTTTISPTQSLIR